MKSSSIPLDLMLTELCTSLVHFYMLFCTVRTEGERLLCGRLDICFLSVTLVLYLSLFDTPRKRKKTPSGSLVSHHQHTVLMLVLQGFTGHMYYFQTQAANISSSVDCSLSFPFPAGESGYYAEAAFRDGHRSPAPIQLQFSSERILGRGGRPWHHEQPTGRD